MSRTLTIVAVLAACVAVAAAAIPDTDAWSLPATSNAIAAAINRESAGWEAHHSPRFQGKTRADVASLCGSTLRGQPGYVDLPAKKFDNGMAVEDIPTSFNAVTHFTNCTAVIGHVRDQSDCGSCWAFGSTQAFNDRHCIATGDQTLLSVEDTTACCSMFNCGFSQGCNGGQPSAAWQWFTQTGVVSGGDYNDVGTGRTCQPYTLRPCAHHTKNSTLPPCPSSEYSTPQCSSSCQSGYSTPFSQDKRMAKSSYSISSNEDIQRELMAHGTVTTAFTVYADFPSYKSGVYRHTSGSELGGHCVAFVGWGVENGTPYWLVRNSWNTSWGLNGYFKIVRGQDECGIESNAVAGEA